MSGTDESLRFGNFAPYEPPNTEWRWERELAPLALSTVLKSLWDMDFSMKRLLPSDEVEDDEGSADGLLWIPSAFERLHFGFVGVLLATPVLSGGAD